MTASQFVLGFLRLAAIVVPVVLTARNVRRAYLSVSGAVAVLAEVILALSVLLVSAELLGLVALDRPVVLIPFLVVLALLSCAVPVSLQPSHSTTPSTDQEGVSGWRDLTLLSAVLGVVVVAAQWCLQTANALGAGMFNFDTLWYHMPFAAQFAQSSSVTHIQFTQADPFVAYYPANAELFHAIGIAALHNDFLSPLLNLMWLAIALLASWCVGRPWRVARLTLLAGCLIVSLPVLSGTQPGEAFNDIVGLAVLLAAAAVAVNAPDDPRLLAVAGLAFGLAVGTKFTFVVPAVVLVAGLALRATRRRRWRTLAMLGIPGALTAGWWYLRDLIAVGNPIGVQTRLGPITLPGPQSPLANASQQTVISEVSHLSLWGSRFAPGLDHALGPLWPLALILYLAAVLAGIFLVKDSLVRVLAIAAVLAGISYLFLPTGGTDLEQSTVLFQINLRYVTPALALGLLIVPVVLRLRVPRALPALAPALAIVLLATQLEQELWPTQPVRHLVFLVGATGVAALIWRGRLLRHRLSLSFVAPIAAVLVLATGAAAFVIQRHYFDHRYLRGDAGDPGLGELYRWAQGISHARIALYGTVEQYPLYGARDTNRVDYLSERTTDGGFRPITSCKTWRATLAAGHYHWVVLTPAPTDPVPIAWTQSDPAMRLTFQPASNIFIFKVVGTPNPRLCA
jgi:hypothetical protein